MNPEPIRINRAPVLTLWASIVAERMGMSRETALTLGQAVAGMTAHSKGVRLGIYAAPDDRRDEPPQPKPAGASAVHDVVLLGRRVAVAVTEDGPRAIAKGELVKPEKVERYLASKFGAHLDPVREHMKRLADSVAADVLNAEGFHLYEKFRPQVPSDEKGWGAKGILDLATIDALAKGR
jgi:hypothetical protein